MAPEHTPKRAGTAEAPKFLIHRPDRAALEALLDREGLHLAAVVIRLAWQLGLKRREIHVLQWEQVDFTASQVRLPDRQVPMEPEVQVFLQRLLTAREDATGPVVLSDRGGRQPAEPHLSYVCRKALDQAGMAEVRLLDLRYDYILRQLERHDWQYVSRVSGLEPRTLQLHFAEGWESRREPARQKDGAVDAERVRAVMEAEGFSACGAAIRLVWQLGLRQEELQQLRWSMVDYSAGLVRLPGRTVPLPACLATFLRGLRERNGDVSEFVLISDRARKPMENAFVSKMVSAALIRGDCGGTTLRDLRRDWEIRTRYEAPVLALLERQPRIRRSDVMQLLGCSGTQAREGLRRMIERGTVVRSGHNYYRTGTVVPPVQQREAVLAYLSNHAGCPRKELMNLLGVGPKECWTILRRLIDNGDIRREDGRYYANRRA